MGKNSMDQGNSYNKLTTLYVFLIICILPLFYLPVGSTNPFYLPKLILWILFFFAVSIILVIAKVKLRESLFFPSIQARDQKRITIVLFLYVITWCISTIFSIDHVTSLFGTNTFNGLLELILGIATFLLVANHYEFKTRHLAYVAATYTIISVLSVLQFFGIDPLRPIYSETIEQFYGQTFATIGNQNQVATCLCVAFIITAIYYIIRDVNQSRSRLLLVCVLIIFAGNVATYSKAGLIAIVVTLLVAFPLIMQNRLYLKRYIQIVVGGILIYIVMNLTKNSEVMNRFLQMFFEAFDMIRGNIDPDYGSARIRIWLNSIELVKQYWTVGSGPDTFKQVYDLAGFNIVNQNNEKNMILSPHNESLRLLITTGISSLVFYWILVISIMKIGFAKFREDKVMIIFILGLLCYEMKLMFNCSSIADIVIFWVLLAIVYSRAIGYGKMNANPR
jgi:O-antigen ligase